MIPLDLAEHIAQHSMMGLTGIRSSVSGAAVIDMDNDDYTMSESESRNAVVFIASPGDGTKTLTIGDYPTTPAKMTIIVFGTAPISVVYSGESEKTAAYPNVFSPIVHVPGVGVYRDGSHITVARGPGGTTTPANASENIIEQLIIPAAAWRNNETLTVNFAALKSNTATTETLRLRVGDQGDATDAQAWTSASMATTTVSLTTAIMLQRINSTTIRVTTAYNAVAPFSGSASASSFADITVDNMDNNPVYVSVTGTNSTGAETVTSKYFRGVITS